MFDNASPLELAYTAPSAFGLLLSGMLLYLSVGDELERRRAGINGLVRLDVQKSIVTAALITVALACLTMVGVNQMATPANPNIRFDPTTAATVVQNALLFVGVDLALIVLTAYRLLQRRAMMRAYRRAQAEERAAAERAASDPRLYGRRAVDRAAE